MAEASSSGKNHFMDQYLVELIQNITMVHPVLDHLLQENLLTQEQYDNVRAEKTTQCKMRELLSYTRGWRNSYKDVLCMTLREYNPGVLENLEGENAERQRPDKRKRSTNHESGCHKSLKSCEHDGCRKKYMAKMKQKYQEIREHNSRPGEKVDLEDRYTNVLMIRKTRNKEEREHEIKALSKKHLQIMNDRSSAYYSPTTIQTLFDPNSKGISPSVIILQGPAGIGKTMTSQKIMLDWASGNIYQDKFSFAFHLSCRDLNTITSNISLASLLSRVCRLTCSDDVMKSVLRDSEELLFIIDGFDELKWSLENVKEICLDPFQETSVDVLLKGLLTKQCLCEASLIITTRPLALKNLDKLIQDSCSRYVDILGFTGEEREKFVHNFFETTEEAEKALSILKDNHHLFTMCAVPIMSWIVCTIIKPEIRNDLDLIPCKTTTSLYLLYLKGLLMYHGREDHGTEQSVQASLKKLCALANKGILNHQILFSEKELDELCLSKFKSVFVNENIFHQGIGTQTCYSFVHLSVQEFFAALYYVLDDGFEDEKNTSLPEICEGKSLDELCRRHPHLALVVRFLFGLCNERVVKEFSEGTGINISLQVRSAIIEWIMRDEPPVITIKSFPCLYETQDVDFIRTVMSPSHVTIYRSFVHGCKEVDYCGKACESIEKLTFYHIEYEVLKVFSPFMYKCKQIWITECYHLSSCCEVLRSVIITNRSLTKLELFGIALEDSEIKSLCDGLTDPGCTLQELGLHSCGLPSSCCDDLCSVLVTNQSLIKLELSWNALQDCGVKVLCGGLRDPRCTLRDLKLRDCGLTSLCCDDLCSVLVTNQSLIKLDLSWNALQDCGVKVLCGGLRDPRCTLRDLSFADCSLTSLCCDDLRSVLVTNRSLAILDLSRNNLCDSGVKVLCSGLSYPSYALKDLRLNKCVLTSLCCEDFRSVLITNRCLRKLALSGNNIHDSGMKCLCDGLRDPRCTLEELRFINRSGRSNLRLVILSPHTLTRVETILRTDLSDSEVEDLLEEFQLLGVIVERPPVTDPLLRKVTEVVYRRT